MSTMTPSEFKDARLALKLSQSDWGSLLGISKRQVIHIEQGTRAITPTITKLVTAINQGFRP